MIMRKIVYELHDAHSQLKCCIRDFEDEEFLVKRLMSKKSALSELQYITLALYVEYYGSSINNTSGFELR